MKRFTFKTDKPTGRFASFEKDYNHIKFNKKDVGTIDDGAPFKIRLMVVKEDINEDGNPNCPWKWIRLKQESKSLQEAKDFLNNNFEVIMKRYKLFQMED